MPIIISICQFTRYSPELVYYITDGTNQLYIYYVNCYVI